METCVVILGMHRSGTSTLTGALHSLGVNMGEHFHVNKRANPVGHFEDLDFLRLNERVLDMAGGDTAGLVSIPTVQRLNDAISNADGDVRALVHRKSSRPFWGWKDPRTCLTIQAYEPYLRNARYVVVRRDVNDVAQSLLARDAMPRDRAMDLIQLYRDRIRDLCERTTPSSVLCIDYAELRADTTHTLREVAGFIGLPATERHLARARKAVLSPKQLERAKRRARRIDELNRLISSVRHGRGR